MILSFINIRKVPREMLKTEGDLANVNEWKIMFDPYNEKYSTRQFLIKIKRDQSETLVIFFNNPIKD